MNADETINELAIDSLHKVFSKWLYLDEYYTIDAPLCAAIANFMPGDPDIFGIVGASGSLKTEVIRALGTTENEIVYPISSITEHTLISGFDKSEETDVIPKLQGRLLTIKDLTTILSKDEKMRAQIFADFRDLTDGYMDKKFGNNVHKTYTDIHSSILFASTGMIEKYYALYSNLGQRMLFFRPHGNPEKSAEQAEKDADNVDQMRKELHEAIMSFMIEAKKKETPGMSDDQRKNMRRFYSFLAIARTNISHDYKGEIDEIPEPEYPTRIAKSINRLCKVHAAMYNHDQVMDDDLDFGLRVIYDNIPTRRLRVLQHMVGDESKHTIHDLSKVTTFSYGAVRKILTDLVALEIVITEKTDDYGYDNMSFFVISDKYEKVLDELIKKNTITKEQPEPESPQNEGSEYRNSTFKDFAGRESEEASA